MRKSLAKSVDFALLVLLSGLICSLAVADDPPQSGSKSKPSATVGSSQPSVPLAEPPTDWIDPVTGHRIVRLSKEPGTASFYFHQNAYNGDKLIVSTNDGLATIDLKTRQIEPISQGRAGNVVVGNKSGNVYYTKQTPNGPAVFKTNVNTKETKEICKMPFRGGSGFGLNADETLLGGSYMINPPANLPGERNAGDITAKSADNRSAQAKAAAPGDSASTEPVPQGGALDAASAQRQNNRFGTRERSIAERLAEHAPMRLFTIDTNSGETKTFHPATDWLNHVQFSPSDPQLMMFCHEGPWHEVDRIWTIKPGEDNAKLMHKRTMQYEIAGHEFFGNDGNWIWYDLQTPRSDRFWLAGVNVKDGQRLWYPIERSQWSVHYNQSHDGKLFAGDGGGPGSVANRTPLPDAKPLDPPANGMFIYLFTPQKSTGETKTIGGETVNIGHFKAEKLVDMSKHNYEFEPNLTFSPDNKWIVFRSNMHGPVHTYAVEVAKAEAK
ncbi:MAG TPA: oligogalacturonate lyase family protein [Pirellulales bacterium]